MLEFGADTSLRTQFGQSALVLAAARGHNDIVQTLIANLLKNK